MKTNWQTKKLDKVCDVEYGTRVVNKRDGGSKYSVYGGGGATFFMDEYNREDRMVIARFAMSESCTRFVKGKFFLNDSGLTVLPKNNKEIDQDFLDFQLISLNDYIYSLARGAAQKNLDVPAFRGMNIYYPESLPEQQRIVAILDEAFVALAKAKENAENNLQNSRELFESYLQSVFANHGKEWEEKILGEVLQKTETVDPTKSPNKEFIYIDVSSVNKENLAIENTTLIKGKYAPSRARKLIKTNDVIFATVRPTLKRIAIIPEEFNEQVCSTGYFVLRTKEYLNNKLVFYFLRTNGFNEKMEKLQKGASYPAVTDSEVKRQIISYPKSLIEQQTIVTKFDVLSVEIKKLEAIYQQRLADLEELKKSILQKAFSGELVGECS